jgi:coenzyme Q-binding protein COQ10
LIADVERYSEFLPSWRNTRILKRDGDITIVEQEIGAGVFRARCCARAVFIRPVGIDIDSTDSPFRQLTIHWRFEPAGHSGCLIRFYAGFELRSTILGRLTGPLFESHFQRIVSAFENRANLLYGPAEESADIEAYQTRPPRRHTLT